MEPRTDRNRQQGAALVEFVLLLGVFFLLIVAIVDLAVLMRVSYNLSEAARHGSRSAGALWSTLPSCNSSPSVSARCDNVSSILDPDVNKVADATCTYLELAGLQRSDWTFSFETQDRPWLGRNSSNGDPVKIGKVRVDQTGAQQCLFCWQTVLQAVNLTAQSNFYLQGPGCMTIS